MKTSQAVWNFLSLDDNAKKNHSSAKRAQQLCQHAFFILRNQSPQETLGEFNDWQFRLDPEPFCKLQ
jgi:hypothetical protein